MPESFGRVPWGQHIDIVSRCASLDEALFYINQVIDGGWSRPELNANIDKIVEWSLQDIQKPLGVATYQLQEVVDRTVAELELKKKQKGEDEYGDE